MFRTLFKRKCGTSDFLARRDDVKCEKSLAYKNLNKKQMKFQWKKKIFKILTNLCLKVRSATANKKKNTNVKQNRRTKPIVSTNFSQVWSPNANFITVMHENDAFSNRMTGMSRIFISDEFVELSAA